MNPYQNLEVIQALFSFKPFKAPGPDGLYPKKIQHIVKDSALKYCHDIFKTQIMPSLSYSQV